MTFPMTSPIFLPPIRILYKPLHQRKERRKALWSVKFTCLAMQVSLCWYEIIKFLSLYLKNGEFSQKKGIPFLKSINNQKGTWRRVFKNNLCLNSLNRFPGKSFHCECLPFAKLSSKHAHSSLTWRGKLPECVLVSQGCWCRRKSGRKDFSC